MVRRKRMGCREGFIRRESFIMEIKVVVRWGWKSWRLRQKWFEGAGTDVGTHLGAEVQGQCWWRDWWESCGGTPRGLEEQRERKMWIKRASGRGLSSSGSLSGGDGQGAGKPCELGKMLDQGELRERWRASDGEGKKSWGVIAENAEWTCGEERRSRNAKRQKGEEAR